MARALPAALLAALTIASSTLTVGCGRRTQWHGSEGTVPATYRLGSLRATLDGSIPIPAIAAAAGAALRDRGYAVDESEVAADHASVTARPQDGGALDSVLVEARRVSDGTRVTISVRPLGDQARSRDLLGAILSRLGV